MLGGGGVSVVYITTHNLFNINVIKFVKWLIEVTRIVLRIQYTLLYYSFTLLVLYMCLCVC
jgi:hypothetical protein